MLPSGATGAVIVAAWLVESKQRIVENMAPVLAAAVTERLGELALGRAECHIEVAGQGEGGIRLVVGALRPLYRRIFRDVRHGGERDREPVPQFLFDACHTGTRYGASSANSR